MWDFHCPPENEAEHELTADDDKGYESCSTGGSEMLLKSLLAAAQPTIQLLLQQGETDAAGSVQALCDYINAREEDYARLTHRHTRCKTKLPDACKQIIHFRLFLRELGRKQSKVPIYYLRTTWQPSH